MDKNKYITIVWHQGTGTFIPTDECEILVLTESQMKVLSETDGLEDYVMKINLEDVIDEDKIV